jgi:diguanylate cyclase (GGDEF)-like protein/PAS domain S-box-containing protein
MFHLPYPTSLKTRIALFTSGLFIVAIWSMAYHSASNLRRDMQVLLSSQQFAVTSNVAERVEYAFKVRVDSLKMIAAGIRPEWINDYGKLHDYLLQRKAIYVLMDYGLTVLRKDGLCMADYPVRTGQKGANFDRQRFFREVMATGKPAFSQPQINQAWMQPAIVVAVPILGHAGEIIGVLAGSMAIAKNDVFNEANANTGALLGFQVISPRDRVFVAATDQSRVLQPIPQPGTNRMLDRYLQGFEGSGVTVNSYGVEELTSAKRVPSTNWLVIGDMPTAEAFAPIAAMQRQIYIEASLASLVVAALIWLYMYRLLAPLGRFAKTMTNMTSSGAALHPLPVRGGDEIAQLLANFNQLQSRLLAQREVLHREKLFSETLIDSMPGLFVRVDREGRLVEWNTNFEVLVGHDGMLKAQANILGIVCADDSALVTAEIKNAWEIGHADAEMRIVDARGDLHRFHVVSKRLEYGGDAHLLATGIDITEQKLRETREQVRNQIFELLAGGGELKEILRMVVGYVERNDARMLCSILLLDDGGRHLLVGAAPSLPDFYNNAVNGLEIGDGIGSCGTAAFRNERVVVEDIRNHRYWTYGRDLAARAGLVSCWAEPIRDTDGKVLGTFAIYQRQPSKPSAADLELLHGAVNLASVAIEKKHIEDELQLASSVYQASGEAIVVTDANNHIVAVNPAFTRVTGYTLEEARGCDPKLLKSGRTTKSEYDAMWLALSSTGQWQGEIWNRRKNGEEYAEWLTINTLRNEDGDVYRRIAMFSDITEKKRTAEVVWRQANYDTLTGLPNRNLFYDRMKQDIKKTHRVGQTLALLYIDLDRFKEVNDSLGHDAGDELLREAATRIIACVRETDTVARLGGDEFTVVLPTLVNITRVEEVARAIIETLSMPFILHGQFAYISASVGIALCPNDAEDVETLLKSADQAMYAAKNSGRNSFSYFTESMQLAAKTRVQIGSSLRDALAAGQFEIYYQPVVEMSTSRIVKAEALLRWHHPEHGMIGPATFIPLAEETGLINEIGDWVFKESARMAKRWSVMDYPAAKVHSPIQISINKSPRQFASGKTQESWLSYLKDIGLSATSVVLEITEGMLLDDHASVTEKLTQFREGGVQVALDDFGTGYSTMAYLKKFHVDYVKIDQSFVREIASDPGDRVIVEAIIAMAHKLDLKVIAEGVETVEQRDLLAAAACDYAQGYLFARPMPGEEFEKLLMTSAYLMGEKLENC